MSAVRTQPVLCCGKKRFATREMAERTLAHIAAVSSQERRPVRAYPCDRGWWHLTSWPEPTREDLK